MDDSDDQTKNGSRPTGVGPGERLQAARIQKGLSVKDVSARMHLSSNILEAIEENNFEEITAPIFVKGYLRAYARIVALDEDEMIVQYIDFYSEEDPPISSTSNMTPELSVGDVRIKWTTYLVILVLCLLLAAWWWNKEQNEESPISLDSNSSEEQIDEAEMASSEITALSESSPDSSATDQMANIIVEPNEPAEVEVVESDETVEVVESDDTVETVESTVLPEDASVATEAIQPGNEFTEIGSSISVEPVRLAPSGSDKLTVIVHADTWADIKDATDYQLIYDLLRADQQVELTGEAPFLVFLGNGHGVEIEFNGESIEVAPRVRDDNTARLRIGG